MLMTIMVLVLVMICMICWIGIVDLKLFRHKNVNLKKDNVEGIVVGNEMTGTNKRNKHLYTTANVDTRDGNEGDEDDIDELDDIDNNGDGKRLFEGIASIVKELDLPKTPWTPNQLLIESDDSDDSFIMSCNSDGLLYAPGKKVTTGNCFV